MQILIVRAVLALSLISAVGSLSVAIVQGFVAMPLWLIARDTRNQSGSPRHTSSGFFCNRLGHTGEVDAGGSRILRRLIFRVDELWYGPGGDDPTPPVAAAALFPHH